MSDMMFQLCVSACHACQSWDAFSLSCHCMGSYTSLCSSEKRMCSAVNFLQVQPRIYKQDCCFKVLLQQVAFWRFVGISMGDFCGMFMGILAVG